MYFAVPNNCSFHSLYRNAVRFDAGEDRTVPHTVTLRGGAMQRDACAYFLRNKIFLAADEWGVSTVLQQNAVLK